MSDLISRQATLRQESCDDWYDIPSDEMTLGQARQAVKDLRKKLAEDLEKNPCGDAISRQAAIDTIESWLICDDYNEAERHIMRAMQSVLYDLPSVKLQESCEDAISRQAVLDAMYKLCDTGETLKENPWRDNPHIDAIADAINNLPSATPQPKTGHWIYDEDIQNWRCSRCNETPKTLGYTGNDVFMYEHFKFCNHCGAKMMEGEE